MANKWIKCNRAFYNGQSERVRFSPAKRVVMATASTGKKADYLLPIVGFLDLRREKLLSHQLGLLYPSIGLAENKGVNLAGEIEQYVSH